MSSSPKKYYVVKGRVSETTALWDGPEYDAVIVGGEDKIYLQHKAFYAHHCEYGNMSSTYFGVEFRRLRDPERTGESRFVRIPLKPDAPHVSLRDLASVFAAFSTNSPMYCDAYDETSGKIPLAQVLRDHYGFSGLERYWSVQAMRAQTRVVDCSAYCFSEMKEHFDDIVQSVIEWIAQRNVHTSMDNDLIADISRYSQHAFTVLARYGNSECRSEFEFQFHEDMLEQLSQRLAACHIGIDTNAKNGRIVNAWLR